MSPDSLELLVRLLLTTVLGGLIGLERELTGQPAGFRTHILVALGAAVFTVAGASLPAGATDPTRIAAQVVTGIGFIGGGAILRSGERVRGITTAASLWLTAAVGLALGLGDYRTAVLGTAVGLLALVALRWFEHGWLPERRAHTLVLELAGNVRFPDALERVRAIVGHVDVQELQNAGAGLQRLVVRCRFARDLTMETAGELLRHQDGVLAVEIRR